MSTLFLFALLDNRYYCFFKCENWNHETKLWTSTISITYYYKKTNLWDFFVLFNERQFSKFHLYLIVSLQNITDLIYKWKK